MEATRWNDWTKLRAALILFTSNDGLQSGVVWANGSISERLLFDYQVGNLFMAFHGTADVLDRTEKSCIAGTSGGLPTSIPASWLKPELTGTDNPSIKWSASSDWRQKQNLHFPSSCYGFGGGTVVKAALRQLVDGRNRSKHDSAASAQQGQLNSSFTNSRFH